MAEYITTKHYKGSVEIKFYPNSHRYQRVGEKDYLIGVTTATGMMDKSRPLIIWATRLCQSYLKELLDSGKAIDELDIKAAIEQHTVKKEAAATSGTLVHEWAENYIKGLKPEMPEDPQVMNGVMAFLRWVNENDIRFIASEKKVYSKKYDYVGTMDCSFTMGKEDHKIIHPGDFKTSSGIYLEMAMQVSAYQEAEAEEHGTKYGDKCIIRFDKNTGDFEAKWFAREEHKAHFQGFLACLELKRQSKVWDKVHGYYSKK